jgi:phytoene dehydrogenase-like protein
MTTHTVKINRAPVLTLWATVVAERLGYDHETALTLGKAVAGLNAQSKGRRLGIFEEPKGSQEEREPKARQPGEQFMMSLLHRRVPVIRRDQGVRATVKGQPIDPTSVKRYLAQKFGHELADVQAAMEALAKAYSPDQLAAQAYALYEQFRPDIPEGKKGWGAVVQLELDQIRSLGEEK